MASASSTYQPRRPERRFVVPSPAPSSPRLCRVVGHLPKGVIAIDATSDLQRVLALMTEGDNVNRSITIVQTWTPGLR